LLLCLVLGGCSADDGAGPRGQAQQPQATAVPTPAPAKWKIVLYNDAGQPLRTWVSDSWTTPSEGYLHFRETPTKKHFYIAGTWVMEEL
jgi:hypothetical protein